MKSHQILGIQFFGGNSREAVEEITRCGGLLVAPAAPSMIALCHDEDYRAALLSADLAIADSGFMVMLWKLFTGESVPRISGLEHMKRLLEQPSMQEPGAVLWVVATESSRVKLVTYLRSTAKAQFDATIYVAPTYGQPVADEALLDVVRQTRPRHIVIAVGGGNQDKLGGYLLDRLDYRPAVHCIGAAIGFLTGDQVRIPAWADKYYLGWIFRSVAQPKVFVPRFWSARKLPWLIWKYRDSLPPLESP
ncbi:MAG TPA: WecB/TagA/CpsF family glycosyltransferase [Chthoniobacterales bacterium]